jgi:DNA replication and repair protein RecF
VRGHAHANLGMFFRELRLRNFRNYENLSLRFHRGVNLFVGNNGQGKTNLVEAVHLLMKGHSFRPGQSEVWLRHPPGGGTAEGAVVQANIEKQGLANEVSLKLRHGHRHFFLDGKRVTGLDLETRFPCVLFSPESLMVIKEGPERRRQLLDEAVIAQGEREARWVSEFRRALKARNRLLKDHQLGLYTETQVLELLEAIDGVYLPAAAALTHARIRLLCALEPYLREALQFIGPQDFVDISVDYEISENQARAWDLREVLANIDNRMKSLKKAEISSGTTLVGPHKHEIRFLSAGNDVRYFCSQGQQRAVILGFKMAQIMYHYRVFQVHPLLLLDDVLSELDPLKGANLLKFLEGIESQIILTTTDIAFPFDFGAREMAVFRMERAQVEALRL